MHFEIYAHDAEKLAKFYSSLFDCGLIKRPAGFEDRGWINYINVDSLDAAVKRAQDLGAKVMKGRAPVPGMGWFAMLVDPQGNSFAMWEQDPNAK